MVVAARRVGGAGGVRRARERAVAVCFERAGDLAPARVPLTFVALPIALLAGPAGAGVVAATPAAAGDVPAVAGVCDAVCVELAGAVSPPACAGSAGPASACDACARSDACAGSEAPDLPGDPAEDLAPPPDAEDLPVVAADFLAAEVVGFFASPEDVDVLLATAGRAVAAGAGGAGAAPGAAGPAFRA